MSKPSIPQPPVPPDHLKGPDWLDSANESDFGFWGVVSFAVGLLFIWSAILFFLQVLHWARFDQWISVSLSDVYTGDRNGELVKLTALGIPIVPVIDLSSDNWLISPSSWFGLHRAITWIAEAFPLSMTGIVAGWIAIWVHDNFSADQARR